MKKISLLILFGLSYFFSFCQVTYVKRITFNSETNSYYTHPGDSNLQFLDVSESPDGNTFIHMGTIRGSTSIYKIDLLGNIIFDAGGGSLGNLNTTIATALHATPDGGCIYASNYSAWSTNFVSYSFIIKIDGSGQLNFNTTLPSHYSTPNIPEQETYDVAVLSNGNYTCLTLDSIYILDPSGNVIRTLNFRGPGKMFGFNNGDFYLECGSFRGRMDMNGNPIWSNPSLILHHDTTLYRLSGNTLSKLDGMTGSVISSIPFTQTGLPEIQMLKDGGWCVYNSTTINRFDSNGVSKFTSTISLPKNGMNYVGGQSDGSLITGGTYRSKRPIFYEYDFSSFIGTIDTSGNSIMDSTTQIWPGDANDDGIVEFGDVVYIALAQGSTGPNRVDSAIYNYNDWQYYGGYEIGDIGTDFPGSFAFGVNHKQCDVYTDGLIDSLDINELASKISIQQYHPYWRMRSPESARTVPYFSMLPDRDSIVAGDTVRIYFVLGNNGIAVDSIFGLAFGLDPFPSSIWRKGEVINNELLNSDLGLINELRYGFYTPDFGILYARKDLQNAYHVQDTIGFIDFKLFDTLSYNTDLEFSLSSFKAITAGGFPVDFQIQNATIYARSIIASSPELSFNKITCSPNPAKESITLNNLPTEQLNIQLFNAQGKLCFSGKTKYSSNYSIDLKSLPSGIYMLNIFGSETGSFSRKFLKQ
ncbi:MAG: T9SS type A sorting domain-containing protein [Bacteroidetes bacterium]|nr:T9SS type A sorting domain-containing protein [Bacteroidota bacterium]